MAVPLVPFYRSKAFRVIVITLLIVLVLTVVWYVYIRHVPIYVTLNDGQIQVNPSVLKGIKSPVKFIVDNRGTEPHEFLLVVTNKPPGEIPVKDGVAQFFTEITDDSDPSTWTIIIYDGFQNGGYSYGFPEPNPPMGPPMMPGEEKVVNFGKPGMQISPHTFTILCNQAGHYERGEYVKVTVNK